MLGRNKIRNVAEVPVLQYANGKTQGRYTSNRFEPLYGFHIQVGKDDAVDAACEELRISQVEIKHPRTGGSEIVSHWYFGQHGVLFFPLTGGPVAPTMAASLRPENKVETIEAGIGIRWDKGEKSKLSVRGYLGPLISQGCMTLVQLSVRSKMSDRLLGILTDHLRVCEAADNIIDRNKHPDVVLFHEIAIPLGVGEEEEWGGNSTTTVCPMISEHPETISAEYLRTRWRKDAMHERALKDFSLVQEWAAEYSSGGGTPIATVDSDFQSEPEFEPEPF